MCYMSACSSTPPRHTQGTCTHTRHTHPNRLCWCNSSTTSATNAHTRHTHTRQKYAPKPLVLVQLLHHLLLLVLIHVQQHMQPLHRLFACQRLQGQHQLPQGTPPKAHTFQPVDGRPQVWSAAGGVGRYTIVYVSAYGSSAQGHDPKAHPPPAGVVGAQFITHA